MVMVSLTMVVLAILSLALFSTVNSSGQAQKSSREQINARYVSEAGLSVAMMSLTGGAAVGEIDLGSEDVPIEFGSATYWVDAQNLGGDVYALTATGVENNVGSRIELVVREVITSVNVYAAFGDEGLTMDSNAMVDSYDSSLGTYASQDTNGNGASSYAGENGHVGSNANISADSNVDVHGDVTPGPAGTATITGNATVSGSTTPASAEIPMPAIVVPVLPSMGDWDFDGSGSGAFHDYIPSGSYHLGDTTFSMPTLAIRGPATLVFESFDLNSNSEVIIDATNGPVEIYVLGDFVMNSNTLLASSTYTPSDLTVNLLSDNVINPQLNVDLDVVDFDSNAQLYGVLYAPNASVEINSNFELFGSLIARRVHLDSNSEVHFDEALLQVDEDEIKIFEKVAWRHTPYHP